MDDPKGHNYIYIYISTNENNYCKLYAHHLRMVAERDRK